MVPPPGTPTDTHTSQTPSLGLREMNETAYVRCPTGDCRADSQEPGGGRGSRLCVGQGKGVSGLNVPEI